MENNRHHPAIRERNRIALAYIELAKDKIFRKLPEQEKMNLIREVLLIGDETAKRILAEYKINDPRKIAAQLGVKVLGEGQGKKLRSEYRKEKKEIVVYRKFHEKLLREVHSAELSENLIKILVAHELFHHLESSQLGEIYKQFRFKSWQFGPWVKHKYIKGLSDVAAQAFTESLLGIEISPETFAYLTCILYATQ
jgi:predicted Zn-dependent protease with MMP-like domain